MARPDDPITPTRIGVLGQGGWGTAMAMILVGNGHAVRLWGHDAAYLAEVARTRQNPKYLPGIQLPDAIELTDDLAAACDAELVFEAIPTAHVRAVLERAAASYPAGTPMISLTKGIEVDTFKRPTEIFRDCLGADLPVATASGPSHAEEVALGLPTTVVVASDDARLAQRAQRLMSCTTLRAYTNPDLLGVELAGALKNIIAVAGGICDGLGFGDNSKAALLTRGLVEISRLGVALGASRDTFFGLAGIGDLITTCFSPFGRNRAVGERIGKGETLAQILASTDKVAEGVRTTRAVLPLARQHDVEMPITEQVHRVLFDGVDPQDALRELMLRALKDERH